ncbi:MAG: acyltransferase family protein [Pseudonocardia sp.]
MTGTDQTATRRTFRPELEGLRALAVLLVVAYHVWFGRVSGGVDVFFLVTGFLLTGGLYRAASGGSLDVRRQWTRTATRLLPTASVVLVATAAAGMLLLPESRWAQTVREIVASTFMLQNWQLAADAVDYGARSQAVSVVQHFWSLSVQVQFMVLWPLAVALVALASRGQPRLLRERLLLVSIGLVAASLWFSLRLTAQDQPLAYFHTLTRLWEFGLGAVLALVIDRLHPGRGLRHLLGWTGVLGLLACGAVLDVTAFPGVGALWPTLCAAMVLVAGATGGAGRLLASRPARYVGALSYPLYLWHWPVLVLFLVVADRDAAGAGGGLAVVAVSVVLAVATHHLLERRLTGAAPRPLARRTAAGTLVVLLVTGGWLLALLSRTAGPVAVETHPGARALAGVGVAEAPLVPPPVSVYEDWVRIERWDCAPLARFPMDMCAQPMGERVPAKRIVVVGDSHSQQLIGALAPIADRRGWQIVAIIRGACPFSTVSETDPEDADCVSWLDAAGGEIADVRPDAVVTLATRDARSGRTEQLPPGFVEQWTRLDALGIPVLAVRDNPRFDGSMPECIERNGRGSPVCGADRESVYGPEPPWVNAFGIPANVRFLDIADTVCDGAFCPAEIGNVLVYMDDNHLSATYAATMADLIEEAVAAAIG